MFKPKPVTDKDSMFHMPGTEGTGRYIVPAASALGRVGFRVLSDSSVRVRVEVISMADVEPFYAKLTADDGWKPPHATNIRFSKVFDDGDAAIKAVEQAILLLGKKGRVRNRKAWTWRSLLRGLKASQPVHFNPFGGVKD